MEGERHVAQDEKEKRDIFSVIGVKDLSSLKASAKGEGLGSLSKLQEADIGLIPGSFAIYLKKAFQDEFYEVLNAITPFEIATKDALRKRIKKITDANSKKKRI